MYSYIAITIVQATLLACVALFSSSSRVQQDTNDRGGVKPRDTILSPRSLELKSVKVQARGHDITLK